MCCKNILKILLLFFLISSNLLSKDLCFLTKNLIRPYKIFSDFLSTKIKNCSYIINKKNFWKVKNCKNIVVFGEESAKIVRERFYDNNTNFIYSFVIFKNSIGNLRNNESIYFLQPEPDFILANVNKILPNANRWLVFYSGKIQKKYVERSIIYAKKYMIKLIPVFADKNLNLNSFIQKNNYDTFWFIPDNIFSTVDVVNFILERLILLKKFSIGFNNFFFKAGATISFEIDLNKTANLLLKNLKNKKHGKFPFVHRILINKKNLRYILNESKQKD